MRLPRTHRIEGFPITRNTAEMNLFEIGILFSMIDSTLQNVALDPIYSCVSIDVYEYKRDLQQKIDELISYENFDKK